MLGYQRTSREAAGARRAIALGLSTALLGWLVACGSSDGGEVKDTSTESLAFADGSHTETGTDSGNLDGLDGSESVDGGEPASSEVGNGDSSEVATNQRPGFDALPSVSVKMGHQEHLDLKPYIDDAEDEDAELVLSWGAVHVGLADGPEHMLLIVGPVDWFGEEIVELTVTDSGGLSASAMLRVEVEEVTPPDPITPPPDCPKSVFTYQEEDPADSVLLSGTFNDWAGAGPSEIALQDPEDDGTWTVELDLAPGTWLYKFIVDGTWIHDPSNQETVDDGYGGFNSVVVVPACEQGGE